MSDSPGILLGKLLSHMIQQVAKNPAQPYGSFDDDAQKLEALCASLGSAIANGAAASESTIADLIRDTPPSSRPLWATAMYSEVTFATPAQLDHLAKWLAAVQADVRRRQREQGK